VLCRVEPYLAGPKALGVLIPQGARTLVIMRPRALPWDLLPATWDGDRDKSPRFCSFTREEAAGIARRLMQTLESAASRDANLIESFGNAEQHSCGIWLRTDEFLWIVCRRATGEAYQPMMFATLEEAARIGDELADVLCPTGDAVQEYYFNTQNLG
jgi:hypothetical protein